MAVYNNGFPVGYQPYQYMNQPLQMPVQSVPQPNTNNGIKWVQGEAGAKSAFVAPGESALFMDSEKDCFYIKSVDASGVPLPLRIFDYSERVPEQTATQPVPVAQPTIDLRNYMTREEVAELIRAEISKIPSVEEPKKSAKKG